MATTTEKLLLDIQVKNTQALGRLNGQLANLNSSGLKLGTVLKGAAAGLAAFGAVKVGQFIINTTQEFENLNTTLASVTGSTEKGAEAFGFISEFATKTQFGVDDLTKTFIKLKAAGIEPTEELLTTFTDTAAVTNDQIGSLEAVTDLFARSVSGGLGLEDLNRLADRGVPVFAILEEQLGLTRLQISEFGKTAEGANKITAAFQKGIQERFGGATENVINNLSTSFSNAKIALQGVAFEFGQGLSPTLKEAVNGFTDLVNNNKETIGALGQLAGTTLKLLVEALNLVLKAIGKVIDLFKGFIAVVTDTVKSVTDFKNKVVNQFEGMKKGIGDKMKGVKDTIVGFFKDTEDEVVGNSVVPDMVDKVIEEFVRMSREVEKQTVPRKFIEGFVTAGGVFDVLEETRKAGERAFGGLADAITDFVMTGKFNFKDFANSVIRDLVRIAAQAAITFAIKKALQAFGGPVGGFISGFLANGGTARAGEAFVVGERGPELFVPNSTGTVVPNERLSTGGETTINFNINAVDAASFDELLISRKNLIVGTIQQAFRQQGRRFA
tara:strand:- start:455 stop:2119 length:1665 start_codon:yes stop_codon:yes gene_type:complete